MRIALFKKPVLLLAAMVVLILQTSCSSQAAQPYDIEPDMRVNVYGAYYYEDGEDSRGVFLYGSGTYEVYYFRKELAPVLAERGVFSFPELADSIEDTFTYQMNMAHNVGFDTVVSAIAESSATVSESSLEWCGVSFEKLPENRELSAVDELLVRGANAGYESLGIDSVADFMGVWNNYDTGHEYEINTDGTIVAKISRETVSRAFEIHENSISFISNDEEYLLELADDVLKAYTIRFNLESLAYDAEEVEGVFVKTLDWAEEATLADYVGEWENDSSFMRLTVKENGRFRFGYGDGRELTGKCSIYHNNLTLSGYSAELTGDGGLRIFDNSGYVEGVFYPTGSEQVVNAFYKKFIGDWYCSETDVKFRVTEDGEFHQWGENDFYNGNAIIPDAVEIISENSFTFDSLHAVNTAVVNSDGTLSITSPPEMVRTRIPEKDGLIDRWKEYDSNPHEFDGVFVKQDY